MREAELAAMVQLIGGSDKPILRSTSLYHDLQIAGDDASELLAQISRKFSVSFDGMHFAAYFPDEAEAMWRNWASKLGLRDRNRRRLTIEHLLAVIERGRWFDPT
jgi:hypothetical protein